MHSYALLGFIHAYDQSHSDASGMHPHSQSIKPVSFSWVLEICTSRIVTGPYQQKYVAGSHCPTPTPITNGVIDGSNYAIGQTITIRCNPGYNLNGFSSLSCSTDGTWSGNFPTCEGKAGCIDKSKGCQLRAPP